MFKSLSKSIVFSLLFTTTAFSSLHASNDEQERFQFPNIKLKPLNSNPEFDKKDIKGALEGSETSKMRNLSQDKKWMLLKENHKASKKMNNNRIRRLKTPEVIRAKALIKTFSQEPKKD